MKLKIEIEKPNGEIETYKSTENPPVTLPVLLLLKGVQKDEIKSFKISKCKK